MNDGLEQTKVWIVGGGRFGRRAIELLAYLYDPAQLLAIDPDEAALAALADLRTSIFQGDGARFLAGYIDEAPALQWIVPSAPIHVALEFLKLRIGSSIRAVPIPRQALEKWPNPFPADQGGCYLSYADFLCPDDCPEPADCCTFTGRPRGKNLFDLLVESPPTGFVPAIIRSRQLAPGLGGYRPTELRALVHQVRQASAPILLATACRCHAVVHALKSKPSFL